MALRYSTCLECPDMPKAIGSIPSTKGRKGSQARIHRDQAGRPTHMPSVFSASHSRRHCPVGLRCRCRRSWSIFSLSCFQRRYSDRSRPVMDIVMSPPQPRPALRPCRHHRQSDPSSPPYPLAADTNRATVQGTQGRTDKQQAEWVAEVAFSERLYVLSIYFWFQTRSQAGVTAPKSL